MAKALIYKELRENWLVAGGALVLYLFVVGSAIGLQVTPWSGRGYDVIPFVGGPFHFSFGWVCAAFALILGFRQTVGEAVHGTWLVLLHRPLAPWRQILLKMFVGASLYLVIAAVPILLYAWWAATPGNHAGPFYWSMTEPAWRTWLIMILIYLGAFTSGVRPARWLGSRLWPLAACGGIVIVLAGIPVWPTAFIWVGGVVLVAAILWANIATVTRMRDYP